MKSKYNNKKVTINGIVFDSMKEGNYYLFLKEKESRGEIINLRRQVEYELLPAIWVDRVKHLKTKDVIEKRCDQRATCYYADFVYTEPGTGDDVVIDVKSKITRKKDSYILKKKMMYALKGIKIREVIL